jgi:DNA-binding MarR family transcriptional regulator
MPVGDDFPAQPSDADGRPLAPLSSAIFLLARAHRAYAAELLRRHGLHPGQELLLLQLYEQDRQTQAALLDAVGLDHSTLSRSLSRMEAAGLVRRSPSPVDRRAVVVSLTAKGKRLREPLHDLWRELERTTSAGVPPEALDDLVGSLHAVRRAVVERARDQGVSDLQRQAAVRDG